MNTEHLHNAAMEKLETMMLDQVASVCAQMGVALAPGREHDRDKLLDAICDASWDGAHGDTEVFDRRLADLLGVQ